MGLIRWSVDAFVETLLYITAVLNQVKACRQILIIIIWMSCVIFVNVALIFDDLPIIMYTSICRREQSSFQFDDVINWKHFPSYWPFVRGIHRSPVNSPHKGQWRGALMFSLICTWTNGWVNSRDAGDLRRHCAHYDVTIIDNGEFNNILVTIHCLHYWPYASNYTNRINLVKCKSIQKFIFQRRASTVAFSPSDWPAR